MPNDNPMAVSLMFRAFHLSNIPSHYLQDVLQLLRVNEFLFPLCRENHIPCFICVMKTKQNKKLIAQKEALNTGNGECTRKTGKRRFSRPPRRRAYCISQEAMTKYSNGPNGNLSLTSRPFCEFLRRKVLPTQQL